MGWGGEEVGRTEKETKNRGGGSSGGGCGISEEQDLCCRPVARGKGGEVRGISDVVVSLAGKEGENGEIFGGSCNDFMGEREGGREGGGGVSGKCVSQMLRLKQGIQKCP